MWSNDSGINPDEWSRPVKCIYWMPCYILKAMQNGIERINGITPLRFWWRSSRRICHSASWLILLNQTASRSVVTSHQGLCIETPPMAEGAGCPEFLSIFFFPFSVILGCSAIVTYSSPHSIIRKMKILL